MNSVDIENYEEMCQPFAGSESAGAALDAFRDELFELRKKYRIKDVSFVCEVAYNVGETKQVARTLGHAGMSAFQTELLLWAATQSNERNIEFIGKLMGEIERLNAAKECE